MSVAPSDAPSSAPALVRRRSAWSLADQAVASTASLAVGLLVSREAPLPEIGAFAIAFAFYQLLFAVGRPLNSDPLMIGFSSAGSAEQRGSAAVATGGALALGAIVVPLGVLAGVAVGGGTGWALAVCALFAPVFLLQDAWRHVFFTRARPAHALVSDAAVLLAVVPLGLLFQRLFGSSGAAFVAGWGGAAAVGLIGCLLYARLWPSVASARAWWRDTSHLARYMLGENMLAMGSYLAAVSIIAAVAGSDELGRLRVTQVAFAPANFVTLALGIIMLAEGSRLARTASRGIWALTAAAVAAGAGISAVLAALWLALPVAAGEGILGSAWPSAHDLVVPVALYFGGIGLTMVLSMALRAMQATRDAFRCRALAAPLTIAAALGGSLLGGPGVAMVAMSVVELMCAAAMVLRMRGRQRARS